MLLLCGNDVNASRLFWNCRIKEKRHHFFHFHYNFTQLNSVLKLKMLTPQIRESASRSVLCWLATADESGQPNVSPKEIFAVVDSTHIAIANIASPNSARNVISNARVCVSFIDVFVQKGYKVTGIARNVTQQDVEFSRWVEPLRAMAGPRFPIHSVVLVQAVAVERILAPSYRLYAAETAEHSQVASAMQTYGVKPLRDV